jgi:hypothetical protein
MLLFVCMFGAAAVGFAAGATAALVWLPNDPWSPLLAIAGLGVLGVAGMVLGERWAHRRVAAGKSSWLA